MHHLIKQHHSFIGECREMKKIISIALVLVLALSLCTACAKNETTGNMAGIVVFQSDFGQKDGAVSAMKGVASGVDSSLKLYDLTHEIPAYSIWDAAYRLYQTIEYWPEGTVFVSVVDPGVGSDRNSVVAKTGNGQYIVTPDNGTLTLVAEKFGIEEVRIIDETINRRPSNGNPYTFHGRDVYAYTGARLASGAISFEGVGDVVDDIVLLSYQQATYDNGVLKGNIPALDIQYGNVWTNIAFETADLMGITIGETYNVTIFEDNEVVFTGDIPYVNTYSDVPEGDPLMYFNSLNCLSLAINMDSFAGTFGVSYGNAWTIEVKPAK